MAYQIVTSFNPLNASAGQVVNNIAGEGGATFIILNDSPCSLQFAWDGNNKIIPAGVADLLILRTFTTAVHWSKVKTLGNVAVAPISLVTVYGYDGVARETDARYPYFIPARALQI